MTTNGTHVNGRGYAADGYTVKSTGAESHELHHVTKGYIGTFVSRQEAYHHIDALAAYDAKVRAFARSFDLHPGTQNVLDRIAAQIGIR